MSKRLQRSRGTASNLYSTIKTNKMIFKAGIGGRIAPGIGLIRNRTYIGGPSGMFAQNNYKFPCYCVNYTLTSRNKFSLVK
mgnify:CR=1 FL=1